MCVGGNTITGVAVPCSDDGGHVCPVTLQVAVTQIVFQSIKRQIRAINDLCTGQTLHRVHTGIDHRHTNTVTEQVVFVLDIVGANLLPNIVQAGRRVVSQYI